MTEHCVTVRVLSLSWDYGFVTVMLRSWGAGIGGLTRGMATIPKVTRSYYLSETKLEDHQVSLGKQVHGM